MNEFYTLNMIQDNKCASEEIVAECHNIFEHFQGELDLLWWKTTSMVSLSAVPEEQISYQLLVAPSFERVQYSLAGAWRWILYLDTRRPMPSDLPYYFRQEKVASSGLSFFLANFDITFKLVPEMNIMDMCSMFV